MKTRKNQRLTIISVYAPIAYKYAAIITAQSGRVSIASPRVQLRINIPNLTIGVDVGGEAIASRFPSAKQKGRPFGSMGFLT